MPADASVFGMFKPAPAAEGPLDQYGKVLNLKHLMGQGKLQDLQTQQAEQSMQENQDFKSGLASIGPSGETPEAKANRLTAIAPKLGFEYQKNQREANKDQASIDHTKAQTAEIKAGDIAGNWATLTQGGSSDEAVKQVHDTMLQKGMPEAQAQAVTQQLLSLPPEKRIPWMTAMAAQHKTGQEALKLFFPPAHMQDTGGAVTPVSTSTMPGAPTPGTPIPGGVPLQKTISPDAVAHIAATERGQNMTDARTREVNGILAGQTNEPPSQSLVKAIASGEMDLKPPPTNARNPIMLQRYGQILEAVKKENPNWSAEMHPTIKKTVAAFATGKEGQTVKKLNTATDHVETLRELSEATKSGNVQLFNKIANQWAANSGNPAPSNLATAAQIVGAEIVGSIVGAGGGVGEREKAEGAFSNVKSPADIQGAINTVTKLMGGQFKGMQKQYEAGTYGRKDFAEKYLSPAAQKALEAAQGKPKEVGQGDQVKAPAKTFDLRPDPAQFKGKRIKGPDGKIEVSDGKKWNPA